MSDLRRRLERLEAAVVPNYRPRQIMGELVDAYERARAAGLDFRAAEHQAGEQVAAAHARDRQAGAFARSISIGLAGLLEPAVWFAHEDQGSSTRPHLFAIEQ